jgi:hypothetical protein
LQFREWPTRDWVDAGSPLMSVASGAAQALFGSTLFAEAVLVLCAFGLAALTAATVIALTGSTSLAVVAALLEVVVLPRTCGYPKMFAYARRVVLFQIRE